MKKLLTWIRQIHSLLTVLGPAVSFYGGSLRLTISRVVGIYAREGTGGLLRRAHILGARVHARTIADAEQLYGNLPSLSPQYKPLVSVIVPNYNHESFLKERLESIYCQKYANFEVILLDDASEDDSRLILEDYARRFPEKTRVLFNESNSGGVFNQWKKGIASAQGELIWIAESDDYADPMFLQEIVRGFQNRGVKLAFGNTEFVAGYPPEKTWSLPKYLFELKEHDWTKPFVKSAAYLVNSGWLTKNVIPNASSAVFRNPGELPLFEDPEWLQMRLCGDWVFYLTISRGGLVSYNPKALNFYRQHSSNTSAIAQSKDIYYLEHEIVGRHAARMYRFDQSSLDMQRQVLYIHWCIHRGTDQVERFNSLYDVTRCMSFQAERLPNILMAVYALTAGGGETFPIFLSNELAKSNYSVTILNCNQAATEIGVQKMVSPNIAILELDQIDLVGDLCTDLGIDIVHSHHAWVDVGLATSLLATKGIRHIVTTHGMYEMMSKDQIQGLISLLRSRVSAFVYTAEKNLTNFSDEFIREKHFTRISNCLPELAVKPILRKELGIKEDDFVLCIVSRAIPEKGWQEAIEAVELANQSSSRRIQLLLIGNGPEADRLQNLGFGTSIHFMGFKDNIRDYFAASDMGFLPSRFKGESAPLVLIDCLLSGKPMLASEIGEIRSMLSTKHGMAGIVFPLRNWAIDPNLLSSVILSVANDKVTFRELSRNVSEAASKFRISKMVESYRNVYANIKSDSLAVSSEINI